MATAADVLLAHAYQRADQTAFRTDAENVTFAELGRRASRTARALAGEGVAAGDRVALSGRDNLDNFTDMFALWMLGATAVPLDFRTPTAEVARLTDEFQLARLLTDREIEGAKVGCIARDAAWRAHVTSFEGVPPDAPPPGGLAVISLSSGTTGRPIGVGLTHPQLALRTSSYGRFRGGEDAYFGVSGFFSFSAVRNHAFAYLLNGLPVRLYPPMMDGGELIGRLLKDRVTNTFVVPTMVRAMLAAAQGAATPVLPQVYSLYCGGSDMTVTEKLAAYEQLTPGFAFCFSASICGTCSLLAGEDMARRPETDGRLIAGVRIEIVDDAGKTLPDGEAGLMRVRSPSMPDRLFGGEGRSQGDRLKDGWAYTGDIGKLSDNFLTVVGRTGDVIVRGGANVYPAEIEHALAMMPGVRECAVAGFASEREGQEIAAYVVAPDLSEEDLKRYCQSSLAPDKRPRRFVLVDALPRNANGKVLRRELAAP